MELTGIIVLSVLSSGIFLCISTLGCYYVRQTGPAIKQRNSELNLSEMVARAEAEAEAEGEDPENN
jgi:hypothetical protein